MTVNEMLERMTSEEINQWIAFYAWEKEEEEFANGKQQMMNKLKK